MGEAKRRAKVAWHPAVGSVADIGRKLSEMIAALPPAPMNGATLLELSPADYVRFLDRAEAKVDCFNGASLFGLGVRSNVMLPDGSIIGRRRGKAVWSNNPLLQDLIDSGGLDADPASPLSRGEVRS